jgi:CubicO group peptidase (beta-lactamase class C family)
MKLITNKYIKRSPIPKDLDSVITIDHKKEAPANSVGMEKADIDAIWGKVIDIYKTGQHPAITVNIRRRGQTIMSRAIGHAKGNGPDDTGNTPKVRATPDTPICLFSTSKAISALLMHMLAEDGLINVMDPVAYYAPEFAKNGKENITIHHILSHRGGVPGLPRNISLDVMWDEDQTWDLVCESKPITTDGSKLAYHAVTGGFVLERIMRNVTGGDFNAYIDNKIRQPMGMKYFTYGIDDRYLDEMSETYTTGPALGPVLKTFLKGIVGFDLSTMGDVLNDPRIHKAIIPSANLVASAVEVTNFFQMMLDGGKWGRRRICKESTIARCVQEYGNWTIDKTLMAPMRYSAGMMLGGEPFGIWGPHSRHAYGHAGLINKFCWADPEREMAATLLNTGLPLISNHIPPLIGFLRTIGHRVPRSSKVMPFALAKPA